MTPTPTPETGTARIRWESEPENCSAAYAGYAGTFDQDVFRIYAPDESDDRWILTSLLPGSGHRSGYGGSAEELKPIAERLLSEFVSSLGAIFPASRSPAVKSGQEGFLAAVLAVACPQCGAGQRENCISSTGHTRYIPSDSHSPRVEMAKRAAAMAGQEAGQ